MKMYLLAAQEQSIVPTLVMFGGIFLVMYFFMIRPQQKKQKEARKFRDNLKEGDNVITIGGVHGKVSEVSDSSVVVIVESGAKLRFEKSAIAQNADGQLANQAK
ncbi:MAG: preprotein translocase subunit YajC [Flavobacteriales bacterium]|jgi:preprotein translocase subunit YajC